MAQSASVSRQRTLIIGFGNPLRGDDGVGQAAIAELEKRLTPDGLADVELIASMQLTPEMADSVSSAKRVIFIDASVQLPPGKLSAQRIWPRHTPSSLGHHFTPQSILLLASTVFQHAPPGYLFTVGVDSMEPGSTLSLSVAPAVDRVVEKILLRLQRWRKIDAHAVRAPRGRTKRIFV